MVAFRRVVLHEQLFGACICDVFGARLQVRLGARDGELAVRACSPARCVVSRRPLVARGAVFVSNLSGRTLTIPSSIGGKKVVRVRSVDAERNFADAPSDAVPTDAVALVEVE